VAIFVGVVDVHLLISLVLNLEDESPFQPVSALLLQLLWWLRGTTTCVYPENSTKS
jgi:hypothetical protein